MKYLQSLILIIISISIYGQPGELDVAFGVDGKTIKNFTNYSAELNSIALQSDGGIIVTGTGAGSMDEDILAVRYLSNGQLDESFGDSGEFIFNMSMFSDRSFSVTIDDFDNIYLAGHSVDSDFNQNAVLLKLLRNGEIDSTFATNGVWQSNTQTDDFITDVMFTPDNKILIAGGTSRNSLMFPINFLLIQLDINGNVDASFGDNGRVIETSPPGYNPYFASIDQNNDIVIGGFQVSGTVNVVLAKFNANGNLVESFGLNGVLIDDSPFQEFATCIEIQSNNKILIGYQVVNPNSRDFGITRYNEDASLDLSFGVDGRMSTDLSNTTDIPFSILIQDDDKIILSGFSDSGSNRNYTIVRFCYNGTIDTIFGNDGFVITDFGFDDTISSSILDSNDRLLCAGFSIDTTDIASFSIARYLTKFISNTSQHLVEEDVSIVFPNPSNGTIYISGLKKVQDLDRIILRNRNGVIVYIIEQELWHTVNEDMIRIELMNDVQAGLYFVDIIKNNIKNIKKIVVQR
jgi:uncharacterized delta-60 repeat protein